MIAASGGVDWATAIGTAAGIVGIAGFFWSLIRYAHRRLVGPIIGEVDEIVERKLEQKLAPIYRELAHNGGTSVKDTVTATRQEQANFERKTEQRFNEVNRRIDRLYDRKADQ